MPGPSDPQQGVSAERLDRLLEETDFYGVVHVTQADRLLYSRARGFADRARGVPNTLDTCYAIASGAKALTSLAVMSLVADGRLALDGSARAALGGAGDGLAPAVTVRQLLSHTAGTGDYLDESQLADIEDYALAIPAERLAQPADFLPLLRGRPAKFAPGTQFAYCNAGYVWLALLIEAVSGRSYYDLVAERVCAPAALSATGFLRLDELPASVALGYLPKRGWITNQHHIPVRGAGDGGAYTTAADLTRLWQAFFAGQIVAPAIAAEMLRPQHTPNSSAPGYGLGFWLAPEGGAVFIEGSDPGISFRSRCELSSGLLYSVLSNTTSGAWPIVKELESAGRAGT